MSVMALICTVPTARAAEESDRRPPGWRRDGGPTTRPINDDDRRAVDAFMQKNSPKRFARIQDRPDMRKEKLYEFLAFRLRMLDNLKQNEPGIYDLQMKRMPIEDEIFDLGWQLRHDADNPDELRKKLRQQVRAMMDSRMEERRLRI